MQLLLLRHGATASNVVRRYAGKRTDEPLSELGRAQCERLYFWLHSEPSSTDTSPSSSSPALARAHESAERSPDLAPEPGTVFCSPLVRARETAGLCFPGARIEVVDGLAEMDFGAFEGRTPDEMAEDAAYRSWVESGCVTRCPEGETLAEFVTRTAEAVGNILQDAARRGEDFVVIVGHGGTVMSALDAHVAESERRPYFEWHVGNCEGYICDAFVTDAGIELRHPRPWPPKS